MKRITIWMFCFLSIFSLSNCDTLQDIANSTLGSSSSGGKGLSNDQIISGLKQALIQGTSKGVNVLAVKDGFFKNAAVKVLFPPEAQKVEKTLRDVGAGQLVDVAIEKINRAAEDAASGAKDIFINAITKMTVTDAMDILMGTDNACTNYLRKTTSSALFSSFNPVIQKSLNQVGASDAWSTVMTNYNRIPFVEKINPDLDDYVTNKAMDGVFLMIEKEEKLIRKDPVKRVTDLLKKVFALQDNK
ncbi:MULTISPECIES: DUF4197 domain-containing protein [unclassified Aureispira]|uniref:DUF4197 domain-containing protein n=1 Tax=unclassified Aureispira TaxID=2649989 RepID=UPI000696FE20|nr:MULTISPECIES: DUF4197 domain-containing protein [unclassified Aureispira]WMX12997.1 DUF4197 domain-containing protein [Aureispira sp. CCB-E]